MSRKVSKKFNKRTRIDGRRKSIRPTPPWWIRKKHWSLQWTVRTSKKEIQVHEKQPVRRNPRSKIIQVSEAFSKLSDNLRNLPETWHKLPKVASQSAEKWFRRRVTQFSSLKLLGLNKLFGVDSKQGCHNKLPCCNTVGPHCFVEGHWTHLPSNLSKFGGLPKFHSRKFLKILSNFK